MFRRGTLEACALAFFLFHHQLLLLTCRPARCLCSHLAAARCPRDVAAAAAAYDPAYLLPFSLACLGAFSTPPDAPETTAAAVVSPCIEASTFLQWGLLAMCLRCLGTKDTPLRCAGNDCLVS